ncbi:hypothetical protein NDN08_008199 [Rhodosorus marinus]|uniref:Pseudouridine synthase RsuA/RluA-like domain-containing protein n=1 Tax=Rhodosorus marinus TaxID=101924 RepID=A0AAV8UZT3_9RHOD|nr:hypothetical protein NDN08_008199 [Rhodosorus marinus]
MGFVFWVGSHGPWGGGKAARSAKTSLEGSGPGFYRRNKELMSPEDYAVWKQDIRKRSREIPLVVDYDPVEVVYEDEDLLAVVKPCGLKIHPAHRFVGGTLVNRVHGYLGSAPFTLHRIDQSTSGIVLMAKRRGPVLSEMSRLFRDKEISKEYLALVDTPLEDTVIETGKKFLIDAPIARDDNDLFARKICRDSEERKEAKTEVWTLQNGRSVSLVCAMPITGRTHQIRLHLRHAGYPIVGDPAYGPRGPWQNPDDIESRSQLRLHAWKLNFKHPLTQADVTLTAAPNPDFLRAMKIHGLNSDALPLKSADT